MAMAISASTDADLPDNGSRPRKLISYSFRGFLAIQRIQDELSGVPLILRIEATSSP